MEAAQSKRGAVREPCPKRRHLLSRFWHSRPQAGLLTYGTTVKLNTGHTVKKFFNFLLVFFFFKD